MATEFFLEATNISCIRQNNTLFTNLSFALRAQEALLIEGENGAGKSSLLRLLSGLATPAEGVISWQGESIREIRTEYNENIHYLGHTNGIKLGLTVNENLRLACRLANVEFDDASQVLALLKLDQQQNELAANLSAGQKRRIALAKLFLIPKKLWILDEPLTSLDFETQQILLNALEQHVLNGGIAIISSHHAIKFSRANLQTLRLGT